jgi:DNA-binding MarR family transcriptional regulator
MNKVASPKPRRKAQQFPYVLEDQIGFVLRQVSQRHSTIFAERMESLTPTQWAAMVKLLEAGPCSQNQLGRITAMDVATIKGVIDRLTARGLTETGSDPEDGRRLLVSLSKAGQLAAEKALSSAIEISDATLAPLNAKERETLLGLLTRLR